MSNVSVDAVGPVVPQNLVVGRVAEWRVSRRSDGQPMEAFWLHIVQHGAVILLNAVLELQIATYITRDAAKAGEVILSCFEKISNAVRLEGKDTTDLYFA